MNHASSLPFGVQGWWTRIVREIKKPESKLHKKETCEAVTIIENLLMLIAGVVGYVKTPHGLFFLNIVYA